MRTAKNMSCSKIIRRRRREAETRNGYIQLLARIILVIVCGGLLFTQGFLLMRAPDNGMFPAIKGGDLLIGFRLQRNFLKNDVVVYKANGKLLRLAGYSLQLLLNLFRIYQIVPFYFSAEKTLLFPVITAIGGGILSKKFWGIASAALPLSSFYIFLSFRRIS